MTARRRCAAVLGTGLPSRRGRALLPAVSVGLTALLLAGVTGTTGAAAEPAGSSPSAASDTSVPGPQSSEPTASTTSSEPTSTTSTPPPPTSTSASTPAPPTTTPAGTTRTTRTTTSAPTTSRGPSSSPPPPPAAPPPAGTPAVPPPFSEAIEAARAGQEALAAETTRLSQLVVDTEQKLAQLELEAEAAADVYRQAETELREADLRAGRAQKNAAKADYELRLAKDHLGSFARNTYISGSSLASDFLLLDSSSPADLIERAGLLESVANSRTTALDRVLIGQARSTAADSLATDALTTKVAAEKAARTALAESTAMLDAQQATLTDLLAQKDEVDAQFYAALVQLLGSEGAAAAFAQYEQDLLTQDAAEAAARAAAYGGGPVLSGQWALPLKGTLTSCYCERWGTMHWGIDIAAPMYTPEYAAGDGVVIQAGPATGFGQAVYIQHDNGDVTVYGHMEVIKVVTGQRVSAGQEIALVGTRGFSTGPHLHFEVHVGGINGTRVDPVIWLANRGIFV